MGVSRSAILTPCGLKSHLPQSCPGDYLGSPGLPIHTSIIKLCAMELRLVMLLALTSSARTSSAPQESEIVNTHSSKCVDADTDTYPNDGTKLQLWGCGGASQQQWTYTNGQIVNTHSGKCVDADTDTYPNDGTKLQLWGCNGGDSQSQQWNGLAPIPDCASWPVFQTAVDLAASPWGSYMMDVYGSAPPPDRFPLSVGSWWMLWDHLLSKHKVQLPKSSGTCAPPNCQLSYYAENNAYAPKATSWIWHPPPYASNGPWVVGEDGGGWVEVYAARESSWCTHPQVSIMMP